MYWQIQNKHKTTRLHFNEILWRRCNHSELQETWYISLPRLPFRLLQVTNNCNIWITLFPMWWLGKRTVPLQPLQVIKGVGKPKLWLLNSRTGQNQPRQLKRIMRSGQWHRCTHVVQSRSKEQIYETDG